VEVDVRTAIEEGCFASPPAYWYVLTPMGVVFARLPFVHVVTLVLALLCLCGTSAHLYAQDATTLRRVKKLHQQAKNAAETGQYEQCVGHYIAAQDLVPYAEIHFNIATCYERDQKPAEAVKFFRRYLQVYETQYGGFPQDANAVRQSIKRLEARLTTEVSLQTEPSGADIQLDDMVAIVGQTPFTLMLTPGVHRIRLHRQGYETVEREIQVSTRSIDLWIPLRRFESGGSLRLDVNIPRARIFIDGKVIGFSPFPHPISLPVGPHQIVVERSGHDTLMHSLDLKHGSDFLVSVQLSRITASWKRYTGISSVVVGAAGIALGVVMMNRANQEFTGTPDFNTFERWQNVGYVGGTTLLTTGISLLVWEYFFTPKSTSKVDVQSVKP